MSENTVSTEIATVDAAPVPGLGAELANLGAGRMAVYSSITGTDFASRVAVVNALTNSTPVADNLEKTIQLKDVVIQNVSMVNERTGELQEVPRITFIDASGATFHATSDVLYKDLKNFFAVLGVPGTWPAPLPVKVSKEKGKVGSFFTLSIVSGK